MMIKLPANLRSIDLPARFSRWSSTNAVATQGKQTVVSVVQKDSMSKANWNKNNNNDVDTTTTKSFKQQDSRCVLFGFARNSSRVDLDMVLGEHRPLHVDPFLNRKDLMFSGQYRLHYSSGEDLSRLNAYLQKKYDKRYYLGYGKEMNDHNIPSSVLFVTRRSVLLSGLTGNITYDNIYGLLAGYHLAPVEFKDPESGEKRFTNTVHVMSDREHENEKNAIVHCASIQEARRLVSNKSLNPESESYGMSKIRITHYHA